MNLLRQAKQSTQVTTRFTLSPDQVAEQSADDNQEWTKGVCPNCGYTDADVDGEGVLWCLACGYSKKGCYT